MIVANIYYEINILALFYIQSLQQFFSVDPFIILIFQMRKPAFERLGDLIKKTVSGRDVITTQM